MGFIEVVKDIRGRHLGFKIVDNGENSSKLVIPREHNGIEIKRLKHIENSIADRIEEIEFPYTLDMLDYDIFKALKNVKRIVFNRDISIELGGEDTLPNLEEVVIKSLEKKSSAGRLHMSFLSLKNLERIIILEQPVYYSSNTVHDCPKLDIQNLLGEGLIVVSGNAFNGIYNDKLILPKSLSRFYSDSFNNKSSYIELNLLSINTYLNNSYGTYYSKGIIINGLKTFKHLENTPRIMVVNKSNIPDKEGIEDKIVIVKDEISLAEDKKIKKARALGVKVATNGINYNLETVKMVLIATSEEHIKNTIVETMYSSLKYDLFGIRLMSNGYATILLGVGSIQNVKEHLIGNSIKELKNYVLVEGLNKIYIYNISKEHIIDNIDKYYDVDDKAIILRPIRGIRNKREISSIREENNKLIIEHTDGLVEEI